MGEKLTLTVFLLKSRMSTPLLLIYSIFSVLSVVEFALSFRFMNIFRDDFLSFLVVLIVLLVYVPIVLRPNKSDVFNVISLPLHPKMIYDSWFYFQSIYKFLFVGFISSIGFFPVMSPFNFPFLIENSLTCGFLASAAMADRTMVRASYGLQTGEILTLLSSFEGWLTIYQAFLLLTASTLVSLGVFLRYRSRNYLLELMYSTFEGGEGRKLRTLSDEVSIESKGEKQLMSRFLRSPPMAIASLSSGQSYRVSPRIKPRSFMILISVLAGSLVIVTSVVLKGSPFAYFMFFSISMIYFFVFMLQTQSLVIGTLTFERPWIGAQIFGVYTYLRTIQKGNLLNLTFSWIIFASFVITDSVLIGTFSASVVLSSHSVLRYEISWGEILMFLLPTLPITSFAYMISFLMTVSTSPNLQLIMEGLQPGFTTVKNRFVVPLLQFIPYIVTTDISVLVPFLSTAAFAEVMLSEFAVFFSLTLWLTKWKGYYERITENLALKGYT
ncbi:hypothetical protein IC006_0309 [Sulfuracidifex tepidarius]|uniref:Uncharacterized protein n=1 Tax=Sulfuracidifex tepidarius TaxID=1294262 RepID=A0A510DS86_9CREN|nr:hypothetical protein [Sulfuracidifex tepidarius]BBG23025.1 hypothetical protein IC006_0309 [Sulfuracidifex tepidarius]